MNLKKRIAELNRNVADAATSQKARKLRRILIAVGAPLLFLGLFGLIINAVSFMLTQSLSLPIAFLRIMLFMLCGAMISVGCWLLAAALAIIVGGAATGFMGKQLGMRICSCGAQYHDTDKFCPKCGKENITVCPCCNASVSPEDTFCRNCGTMLR
ncbi:MAG: zinc ribbon domain-containing protein [Clostridia bacterium]|nr:zinc ribbon domain-containing protein [Clostridia bacterium]